jgi:hypothetical protein
VTHLESSSPDHSPGQRVKNEHLFAEANQRMYELTRPVLAQADTTDFPLDFTCECASIDCQDLLEIPAADFAKAHTRANHFIVKPGHVHADIEVVYRRYPAYWIVKKTVSAES